MGLAAEEDEVQGWGVEKGDPTAELARGRELLRGAVSYFEVVRRVKKLCGWKVGRLGHTLQQGSKTRLRLKPPYGHIQQRRRE